VAPLGGFPDDLKYVAAAVADDAPVPSPPATLAAVLAAIESRYDEYLSDGFGPARQAWLELSDTIGRYVQAHTHHGLIKGMATGLDGEGNLLVEPEEGEPVAVSVGEVIHLR
jgi:BirA family biotin operon repressor/biotin-[acetyl-CoA-carboxylase] ligase